MESKPLDSFLREVLRTGRRFPFVLAASACGMGAALRLNHLPAAETAARSSTGTLMLTAWVGVVWLFGWVLFSESNRWRRFASLGLQVAASCSLVGLYFWLAASPYPVRLTRFGLLLVACHMFAMLAPSLNLDAASRAARQSRHIRHFWFFNIRLATRSGLSLLYAGLAFTGCTIALAALKTLFQMPIADRVFLDPAIVSIGAVFMGFFLSGVPRSEGSETLDLEYPRQLRLATRFLLIPLVAIYLGILYAYAAKVLIAWSWPNGWVSNLILALCAMGLGTMFLVEPLGGRGGSSHPGRGVDAFIRAFPRLLFPLLLLLFAALGRRVHEYGLTEDRYLALALAVWLAGITLHSLLDRHRDIRVVPASLGFLCLFASFGPWGAEAVSREGQIRRLHDLLEGHGMLGGGKLAKAPGHIPREVNREIAGVAQYLEERGRLKDLKAWIPSIEDSGQAESVPWHHALDNKFAFLNALELPFVPEGALGPGKADKVTFICQAWDNRIFKTRGYDFLVVDYRSDHPMGSGREVLDGEREGARKPKFRALRYEYHNREGRLAFHLDDSLVLNLDVGGRFRELMDRYPEAFALNLPEEEMEMSGEAGGLKARLCLKELRGGMIAEDGGSSAEAGGEEGPEPGRAEFTADVYLQVKEPRGKER